MRTSRRHENALLFVGRVLGQVQLYGEREGGGERVEDGQTTGSRVLGPGSFGERYILPPPPPFPSNFQVLPSSHSGSETSGARDPGQAELGAASQALAGACWRQAVSEVSLLPMGQAAPVPSGSAGAAREGERTSVQTRMVGRVRVLF